MMTRDRTWLEVDDSFEAPSECHWGACSLGLELSCLMVGIHLEWRRWYLFLWRRKVPVSTFVHCTDLKNITMTLQLMELNRYLTVMLGQKCSKQFFPFGFLQFLFHHNVGYDWESTSCHPNLDSIRLGLFSIRHLRICSFKSSRFNIVQELPCHFDYKSFMLLWEIATRNAKILQDVFMPDGSGKSEAGCWNSQLRLTHLLRVDLAHQYEP